MPIGTVKSRIARGRRLLPNGSGTADPGERPTQTTTKPHPDTMNDDLTLLASAYLDGEVDAAERARVEADPAVMARSNGCARCGVRCATSLIRAPWRRRTRGRDRGGPCACDAAGSDLPESGTETPAAAGDRSPHVRAATPHSTRWLSAAAALVAVAALGVVVSRFDGRATTTTSSVAVEAPADSAADGDALFDTSPRTQTAVGLAGNAERTASRRRRGAGESGGAEPSWSRRAGADAQRPPRPRPPTTTADSSPTRPPQVDPCRSPPAELAIVRGRGQASRRRRGGQRR